MEPELLNPPPRAVRFYRRRGEGPHPDDDLWFSLALACAAAIPLLVGWRLLDRNNWDQPGSGSVFVGIGIVLFIFGLLLSPFGFMCGARIAIITWKSFYLVKHGLPAIAEVSKRDHGPCDGRGAEVNLTYVFDAADGTRVEHTEKGVGPVLWRLDYGSRLTVLYAAKRPRFHQLYESCVFKARL